jgi:Outer membrane protein beta-barrel domain
VRNNERGEEDLRNRTFLLLAVCGLLIASAVAQTSGRNYPRFNFDVGGGTGIGRGAVGSFVGNSYFGEAGAGMNFSRMFGFNAEYMYYDLPIRQSVSQSQSLNNTSGSLNAVSLNAIVRPPAHLGKLGVYGIIGGGFYRRSVSSSTGQIPAQSLCQPSWVWWDIACSGNPPRTQTTQNLGSFSKDSGGYNFGGGVTYRLNYLHNAKLFAEFRYHKAYHNDIKTIVMPLAVGLRW